MRVKVLEIYFFVTFLLFIHVKIGAFNVSSPLELPFSCLNDIFVPLNEDCQALVSSSTVTRPASPGLVVYVTQGDLPSALNNNQVKLTDTIFGEGTWMYGLYQPSPDDKGLHQLVCSGQIYSEDQIDPLFRGWQDADGQPFQQYNTVRKRIYGTWRGTLNPTVGTDSLNFGQWSCWQEINEASNANTFPNHSVQLYDTISFTPTQSGIITIVANHSGASEELGFNPIIAVYGPKGFNPNQPCENLRWVYGNSLQPNNLGGIGYADDDIGPWSLSKMPIGSFQINAHVGEKFTFLVTTFLPLESASDFSLYFFLQDKEGKEIFPFAQEEASDQLKWDSSFVHLELKTTDIEEIYLSHQQILGEDQYPGSTASGIDPEWVQKGSIWLGERLHQDSGFFNLVDREIAPFLVDSMLYHYGFRPLVEENCTTWEVSISDSFISHGECGELVIERTFVVQDLETKTDLDTAIIQLVFRSPNINDVRLPPYAVYLDCEDWSGSEFSSNNLPGPNITGFPFLHTLSGFQPLFSGTFSRRDIPIGASYEDKALLFKDHLRYSFRREWTIYDWCQPWATVIYHQLVHLGDWSPPVIDTASIDVISRSMPDQCDGILSIPKVNASDLCSETAQTIKVFSANKEEVMYWEGNENGEIWVPESWLIDAQWNEGVLLIEGLPRGQYQVQWIVKDEGENADSFSLQVFIEDAISPTCMVEDSITLSLNDSSILIVGQKLDRGSWDNCYDLDFKISLDNGNVSDEAWMDHLLIECDQEAASFPVYLKVTEKRPLGEGLALSTVCRTFIELQDSRNPRCRDMEQRVLSCNDRMLQGAGDLQEDWNIYFRDSITPSHVLASPYCGSIELIENIETSVNLASCGFGQVVRTYAIVRPSAENFWADTCSMTLQVVANHRYQINFPGDQWGNCSSGWIPSGLQYSEEGCDLITSSVHQEEFAARAEECYQIHRTFSVINWCEYVPECSIPWTVERRDWDFDGIKGDAVSILVAYEEAPSGKATLADSNRSALWILQGASGKKPIDSLSLKEYIALNQCEVDSVNKPGLGFFKYRQIINVRDTVPPEIFFNQTSYTFESYSNDRVSGCSSPVQIKGTLTDECTTNFDQIHIQKVWIKSLDSIPLVSEIDPQYYGLEDTVFNITLDLPIGHYELYIQATDGCGNQQINAAEVKVVDAKGPAPICIDALAVELMPDLSGKEGVVEVFAADFLLQTPIEDCSGDTRVYRIVHVKPPQLDPLTRLGNSSLILHCKDIDFSGLPLTVAIIAEDSSGNKDYCTSQLVLQDNLEICGFGIISGQIKTGNGYPVSDVTVFVNDSLEVTRTRSDGSYSVGPVSWGQDYFLLPQKNGREQDGISTLDIIMVSRHLLGEKLMTNPYQLIAADVNLSNSVSTLDIIWMRKMILKQIKKFPHEKSWRFIPEEWEFSNSQKPWEKPFPELTEVQNLKEDQMNRDFIAVKIGDVNFSFLNTVEARGSWPLIISYQEMTLVKGNRYEITFYGNREDVNGFQFELAYSGLQIENFVEGKVKAEHLNRSLGYENKMLISWNGPGASGCLFTLVFTAMEDGLLSDKLKVSQEIIKPEGYEEGEVIIPIELRPIAIEVEGHLSNEVNLRSNPVQGAAYFDFILTKDQLVNLVILDNIGRVVYEEGRILEGGKTTWEVEFESFLTSGLYYYQIEFNQAWYSGKMIRLNH